MTTPFLVRGDTLPELGGLAEGSRSERARGLLWEVDLAECGTRRQARNVWHEAISGIRAELDAHPEIRRICLAYKRPTHFPQSALVRMPEGLARRLHNDFERDRARYVCVLVIDLSGCSDQELLYDRLCEALTAPVPWSDLTLTWGTIADSSVLDAWASDTL